MAKKPKPDADALLAAISRTEQAESGLQQVRQLERSLARSEQKRKIAEEKYAAAEKEIAEYAKRQEYIDELETGPNPKSVSFRSTKPSGSATAIIAWNDWHVEEYVDPATVNGLNAYDLKIAEDRFRHVLKNSVKLLNSDRTISNIRDIVLAVLGDMITGYIHEELMEGNLLSPTEALLFAQDMIATGIDFLLKEADVDSITVVTSIGNHGRTTPKRRIATAYKNSFEWLMYQNLARTYRNNPRVKWKIERSYHNFLEVQGKVVRFHHGDALRYQGGIGGITIPVLKAISQWDKAHHADLDVFGHWHQLLPHRKFVACNCMIGYTPYSAEIKADFSPPSQTYIVMDKTRPHPVVVREIYCVPGTDAALQNGTIPNG